MTEPALKTRVLTKVRRQFLHKVPPADDNTGHHTNLVATPEQLSENTSRLLEPSLGLTESHRNIYAGFQYLNPYYKVTMIRVEQEFERKAVVLDLQCNNADMLPWEYYVKRLESYGDLELATWADRLRSYHEGYPRLIQAYNELMNTGNPLISAAIAAEAQRAAILCRNIEKKYACNKMTLYGNKDRMVPVSMNYNEAMLKEMGQNVDSFVDWARMHGVPALFKGDTAMEKELSKIFLNTTSMPLSFFQSGPEFEVNLYELNGRKRPVKMKMHYAIDPAPEGFFVNIYIARIDSELGELCNIKAIENGPSVASKDYHQEKQDNAIKCKYVKKKDSDSADESKETHEEDQSDHDSDC